MCMDLKHILIFKFLLTQHETRVRNHSNFYIKLLIFLLLFIIYIYLNILEI